MMRALIRSPVLAFTCAGDGRRGHCVAPPGGKEQPARAPPPPPPPPPMALLEFRRSGLPSTAAIEGSAQQRARLPDVLYSVDAGRREQTPAPAPPRSSHMISRGGAQVAAAVQPMATMSISALDRLLTYAPSRMHSG